MTGNFLGFRFHSANARLLYRRLGKCVQCRPNGRLLGDQVNGRFFRGPKRFFIVMEASFVGLYYVRDFCSFVGCG